MLAVQVGPAVTVAAVEREGHRSALLFGDQLTLPTPTVQEDDSRDLVSAVTVTRREAAEPVIAALAEHLRAVASYAGQVDTVVVTVPPGWGPRHHEMVTQAGQRAGSGMVQVVSEAAAVATASFPGSSDGALVLVCHLGERASEVSVLRRHAAGWERIATQPIRNATGERLIDALTQQLGLPAPVADSVRDQLSQAQSRLLDGQTAAVILTERPSPASVTPADLHQVAQPLRQAVADAVLDTLDAADVDADRLHGAVVYGEAAQALSPSSTDDGRLGISASVARDGRLAAVYGALDCVRSAAPKVHAPTMRAGWWKYPSSLAAPMVCMAAGGLLVWQTFDIVARLMPPEFSRLTSDYEKLRVYFDTAAFALAGWAWALVCLTVGRNVAAALLAEQSRAHARQAGQIFAFSGLLGLVVATLQGLLGQAIIGGPVELAPPYLSSALAGAVVPSALAIVIGLAAPWLRGRPLWTERVRFPVASLALAAVGVLAVNARASGMPMTVMPTWVAAILGVTGAGLLGVAIALALVTAAPARLILASIMGAACMVIVGYSTLHSTIVIYLVVIAVWWIRRTSRILADNLPPGWWRRFAPTRRAPDDKRIP